jgi:hypothetical protein
MAFREEFHKEHRFSRHNYAALKAAAMRVIEADRVTIENY